MYYCKICSRPLYEKGGAMIDKQKHETEEPRVLISATSILNDISIFNQPHLVYFMNLVDTMMSIFRTLIFHLHILYCTDIETHCYNLYPECINVLKCLMLLKICKMIVCMVNTRYLSSWRLVLHVVERCSTMRAMFSADLAVRTTIWNVFPWKGICKMTYITVNAIGYAQTALQIYFHSIKSKMKMSS